MTPGLVLASGSPRRRVLLGLLIDEFQVVVPNVDESLPPGDAAATLEEVAERKAQAVAADIPPDTVVIAADTAILQGQQVLGKPTDRADADAMLRSLSGRDHEVVTAVAITGPHGAARFHVSTRVRLDLPDDTIAAYLKSGAWEGKAGAYGVQDPIIQDHVRLDGPWSNVVGLPLHPVHQALVDQGIVCHHPPTEAELQTRNPF